MECSVKNLTDVLAHARTGDTLSNAVIRANLRLAVDSIRNQVNLSEVTGARLYEVLRMNRNKGVKKILKKHNPDAIALAFRIAIFP